MDPRDSGRSYCSERRESIKPSDSKFEILGSNPSVPVTYSKAQFRFWKGSLTGKAVVLKTTALSRMRVRVLSLPPLKAEVRGQRCTNADVAQLEEALVLETRQCGFES